MIKPSVRSRFILYATGSYVIHALAWIFLSDQLLSLFADIDSIVWLSTAKGVFFVIATATLFYLALRIVPPAEGNGNQQLIETLTVGSLPERLPVWLTYSFAVVVTLAMLLLRKNLPIAYGDRPLLILFMLPIILSALLGGLGAGLVSTFVAALGVAFMAVSQMRGFSAVASHDLLQWGFLIVNGIAVSLLSEVSRRAIAKIEINRRLLDTVISGTPDAVFVKDAQGRYLLANAAAAGFIGKSQDEIIGKDDRALFPEKSARELMALDSAIMATGRAQTHEERLQTLDGKDLVFLVTKGPVFDTAGQTVGLFGISREISDRKRAEDEIRQLNADLERRVAERTAELRAANLELEDIAYALAHNLRAPLRAISGFAQLLDEEHVHKFDTQAENHLDQIVLASSNMGTLIDGILALLRCTRGELHREKVDVSMLARQRLDELARREPGRSVILQVEPDLTISGDAAMLEVVMTHLVDNAWKFTCGKPNATIRVTAGVIDGHPGICIADNGAGFDMAHAERLYQPFQRLHRQDEFPGIGIGLATARRIILRHGGELRASAVPGEGATICFYLPEMPASMGESNGQQNHSVG